MLNATPRAGSTTYARKADRSLSLPNALAGALQTKADYPVHVLLPRKPKKSCTGRRAVRHPCTARGGGHGGVGVGRLACSRSIDANPRACATRGAGALLQLRHHALHDACTDPKRAADLQNAHSFRPEAPYALLDRRLRRGGRPSTVPFSLARASPALTLSRMMPRSNSAKTPNI